MARWWNELLLRSKSLFKKKKLDRDLEDELAFHLAMREAKNRSRGISEEEARYAARRQFGNLRQVKDACREMRIFESVDSFCRDLRYGGRTLAKNPGFTAMAVTAIALGIGVNTGIFSVLNGVALKLLPIPQAQEILSVDQVFHGKVTRNIHGEPNLASYSEYKQYRDSNHVFTGLLAYEPFLEATVGGEKPQVAMGSGVSCNYFDVLGEKPSLGRVFIDDDCRAAGSGPVVVISDNLWRNRFGADPAIIGQSVTLNRSKFTVIGIALHEFTGLDPWPSEFWAPLTMDKSLEPDRDFLNEDNTGWLALLGRVKPGVSIQQVNSDLSIIAARIDAQSPGRMTVLAIRRATYLGRPEERSMIFTAGVIVLVAVGLVLLIACANVANLLLARASARQKEIAIRLSIGGSRWRVVRQLLTESLLISLIGGTLGSLLSVWSITAIARYVIAHLPHGAPQLTLDVSPDLHVLAYSLILTVLTGAVFGLAPALHATRQDLISAIKADGGAPVGKVRGGRLRNILVGMQVAVCMILLIAAGLLMHGLYQAQTVNPGFEMNGITQVSFDLPSQGYNEAKARDFQSVFMERVKALPGIDGVEQARVAPLDDHFLGTSLALAGETQMRSFEFNVVSPGYFNLLAMPVIQGRTFTDAEVHSDAGVIVVTESTARSLWPGQNAIGKVLRSNDKKEKQVVGVVRDSQASHLGQTGGLFFYSPAGPKEQNQLELIVHSNSDPASTSKAILEVAREIDADLVVEATKLEDNLEVWRMPSRIMAALSGVLGTLAMLLASIGVYGVASYAVSQRIREIGIRMALGANGREVLSLLLRQAMRPVLIGALIGIAGCAAVSELLSKVLYGIGSHDPISFIGVPLFLLGVALMASYIPARRAIKVDPMVALRYE
jgi:predicted permease